jgi:hypothetical protein
MVYITMILALSDFSYLKCVTCNLTNQGNERSNMMVEHETTPRDSYSCVTVKTCPSSRIPFSCSLLFEIQDHQSNPSRSPKVKSYGVTYLILYLCSIPTIYQSNSICVFLAILSSQPWS